MRTAFFPVVLAFLLRNSSFNWATVNEEYILFYERHTGTPSNYFILKTKHNPKELRTAEWGTNDWRAICNWLCLRLPILCYSYWHCIRAAVHGLLEQLAAERNTRTARAVGVDCLSCRLLTARATLPNCSSSWFSTTVESWILTRKHCFCCFCSGGDDGGDVKRENFGFIQFCN